MMDDRIVISSAISKDLAKIGTTGRTSCPDFDIPVGVNDVAGYREQVAGLYEFFVASRLRSQANKRFDIAKKRIDDMGMLTGMDKCPPGEQVILVHTPVIQLVGKKKNPSKKIDTTKLRTELIKQGVSPDVVDACYKKATTENAPAKEYIPVIVGAEDQSEED